MERRGFPLLGAYLKRRRRDAGLVLRDVQDITEDRDGWTRIPFGTLAKIEKGETSPSIEMLLTLSAVYSTPLRSLVDHIELDQASDRAPARESAERLRERGRRASAEHDPDTAVACFAQAMRQLGSRRRLADASRELLHRLHVDLATACRQRGDHRVAEEVLRELVASPGLDARLAAYALYALAQLYLDGEHPFLAQAAAREALRRDPPRSLRYAAEGLIAAADETEGRFEEAAIGYRRAIAGLHGCGESLAATVFLTNLAYCLVRTGHERRGLALHDKALGRIDPVEQVWVACRAHLRFAQSWIWLERWPRAAGLLLQAKRLSVRANSEFLQFHVRYYLRQVALRYGGDEEEARFHWTAMDRLRPRIQVRTRELREFDDERARAAVCTGGRGPTG